MRMVFAYQKVKTIVFGSDDSATGDGLPMVTTLAGVVSECTMDMLLHVRPRSVLRRVTTSVGPPSVVHGMASIPCSGPRASQNNNKSPLVKCSILGILYILQPPTPLTNGWD